LKLKVGTRRSPLAVAQTRQTVEALAAEEGGLSWELVEIHTTGDRIRDRPLREAGGKGLFVKELDDALLDGRVDCAVHSLKDVPSELPEGLSVAAYLRRASPLDVLVTRDGRSLAELPAGSRLGTTSPRRAAQALACNPSLEVVLLRGSVATRLERIREAAMDATFLARAGLDRLGIDVAPLVISEMDPQVFVPAVGQGAIAVTVRSEDAAAGALWAKVNDAATAIAVEAERAFARVFGGGCHLPIAAYAVVEGDAVRIEGLVASPDGTRLLRDRAGGPCREAQAIGRRLGAALLDAGAAAILQALEGSS
jgi:hydroxymethylbilane synthase